MKKELIALIALGLLTFAVPPILATQYDYIPSTHKEGYVYQVNQWTGKVRVIIGDKIRNIRDADN